MVTIKELIEQLQTLDPELRVFTRGYEGGYGDVCLSEQGKDFVEDYHDEWYYGSHELLEQCYGYKIANYKTIKGIVL